MDKALTSRDVPQKFWELAFLVGTIPQKALNYDPRISYALFVPPNHYANPPSPPLAENTDAGPAQKKLPLLIHIHSTKRDSSAAHADLVSFAQSVPCALAAPLFPAGLEGPNDIDSYKLMRTKTLRSDLALLAMIDEIAGRWPGIDTEKVYLMGFSGGGQFVQRFLYLHPERLAAASIGAPGRATSPSEKQDWPEGLADAEAVFGRRVNWELIQKVRLQLIVGGNDKEIHGDKEFWAWVKEQYARRAKASPEKNGTSNATSLPSMSQGRVETMKQLQLDLKGLGIEAQFDIVHDVAHKEAGVRDHVLRFLQPLMQN